MNSSDIKKETKSNLGVQRKPSLHHFSLEYGKVTSDPLGYLHIHKYVKYIFFCRPILLTIIVRKKIHPFKRYKNLSFTCLTSKMSFTGDTKTKKENKQKSIKFVVFYFFIPGLVKGVSCRSILPSCGPLRAWSYIGKKSKNVQARCILLSLHCILKNRVLSNNL